MGDSFQPGAYIEVIAAEVLRVTRNPMIFLKPLTEHQSLMRSFSTIVWSRSGPTPMAEKRVPESFSSART